MFVLREN
jgi:hypothetical protein